MLIFQETQNSKISENSDNNTGDYSSFKITKIYFQKKSSCNFFGQINGKYPTKIRAFNFTTVGYPVYWTFKITLSSIGFEWKKVLICKSLSSFLCCDLSVIMFSSKGKGFRFP